MAGGSAGQPEREVRWTSPARQDLEHWQKHDRRMLERIQRLIADIREHPFTGIGKPEPLRYEWTGYWSRRITREHRLVYRVEGSIVFIAQCRFHYD